MSNPHNVKVIGVAFVFLPTELRLPLKFGTSVIEQLTDLRVRLTVERSDGTRADGWGETPLSAGWAWPGTGLSYPEREERMKRFAAVCAEAWRDFPDTGHAMELGNRFNTECLEPLRQRNDPAMPHLAALIVNSAFDLALHDAYGMVNAVPTYSTYNAAYMNRDLAYYYGDPAFAGKFPEDFFVPPAAALPVWHLVGGKDFLSQQEADAAASAGAAIPNDGHPVTLPDWICQDGLNCLKIKLTGSDADWDYQRLVNVGTIAGQFGVEHLSPDFNCLVKTPEYVNAILDRLQSEHPAIWRKLLYVEQPFPYDLEANRIDVHSVSARKPLFMDESAHNWKFVKLGCSLGWNGVALKVCKTQTGALLSGCWAKQHAMQLMVQDLTNPMLAIVPHVLLAAHIGTIMGVECNAMQFYPDISAREARHHPGLYVRRNGKIDLHTLLGKPGFGYGAARPD